MLTDTFSYIIIAPAVAPNLITAFNKSSTSLVVEWSHVAEEDFRGEPYGYSITYLGSDLKKYFVYADYLTNSSTLTNLDIYTMYVINVSAVSSGGIGPENTARARTDAAGTVKFLMISKKLKKKLP